MGTPAWSCILCKHTVWEIHPRESLSWHNLWSASCTKQLEASQESRQIFKRSIEGKKTKITPQLSIRFCEKHRKGLSQ